MYSQDSINYIIIDKQTIKKRKKLVINSIQKFSPYSSQFNKLTACFKQLKIESYLMAPLSGTDLNIDSTNSI
jgi:hypothetical protein